MSILDVFWIFFMVAALQPYFRQRMLEAARARLIAKIEKEHQSRVILLVHRQETMSLLGFPLMRFIDIHDSEEVIRAIHLTGRDVPIDIVIHTPGGLVLAALQIARALANHPAKVRAFIPHHAMSGGTLIALAADEIVMCEHSVLGPVDPQLGQYPAASLLKVVEEKPIAEVDDQTLIMADQARKAIRQVEEAVFELLAPKLPEEKARELARTLSTGRWTHDYPIRPKEAKELGFPVSLDMPEDILLLMQHFPQPVQKVPTVEYLPIRRNKDHNGS